MGRFGLEGSVAIVTGGSLGIGRATARLFISEGASVLAVARQRDRLDELHSELGDRFAFETGDVRDPEVASRAVGSAVSHFGRLDALVNNAGWGREEPFDAP